jgi:hypothetical protein
VAKGRLVDTRVVSPEDRERVVVRGVVARVLGECVVTRAVEGERVVTRARDMGRVGAYDM